MRAAIGLGMGFTNDEAAKFAGKSVDVVKRYKTDPPVQKVIAHVEAAVAIQRSKSIGEAVAGASEAAEDRIKRLFDRTFKLTERLVKQAEDAGDALTLAELMDIHKNITVWASKFAASEAPKRFDVNSKSTQLHVHVLSLSEAGNLLRTRQELQSLQPKALIAEANVIDVVADA